VVRRREEKREKEEWVAIQHRHVADVKALIVFFFAFFLSCRCIRAEKRGGGERNGEG